MKKTLKKDLFLQVKTDRDFKSKLSAYARKKGVNLSSLVRQSLEKEMNQEFERSIESMLKEYVKKVTR
jgi:hypothetical protein